MISVSQSIHSVDNTFTSLLESFNLQILKIFHNQILGLGSVIFLVQVESSTQIVKSKIVRV